MTALPLPCGHPGPWACVRWATREATGKTYYCAVCGRLEIDDPARRHGTPLHVFSTIAMRVHGVHDAP